MMETVSNKLMEHKRFAKMMIQAKNASSFIAIIGQKLLQIQTSVNKKL